MATQGLVKLEDKLAQAPSLKAMFHIEEVEQRFLTNYKLTTGKDDGKIRFQNCVYAYLDIIADKPNLAQLDRFQHLKAIVTAGRTGLPFEKLYVMPGPNGTIKIQSSPAGKREMMERMPEIKRFPDAQVVLEGDVFIFDKLNGMITKHETTEKSPKPDAITLDNILYSYQRMYWANGAIEDIVINKTKLLKAKSKSTGKTEASFWYQFPEDACKKVATNSAFNKYHKYPEGVSFMGKDDDKEEEVIEAEHTVQASAPAPVPAEPVQTAQPVITKAASEADEFLKG